MSSENDVPVLIIGAGASGLALAHELTGQGVRPRIVDAADSAGWRWRARHPQLRLNTHKLLSHLPGRRFGREVAGFPSRDDMVGYLDAYERALGVNVERGVRVERIEKSTDRWVAESSAGRITARDLVVATGPDSVPTTPGWPGADTFKGRIIHAAEFGAAAAYEGKKLLLVGGGNSSVDLANHLASVDTRQIWMSVRRGPTVVPQHVMGVPTHLLTPIMRPLPTVAVDAVVRLISRWFCGDLTKHGLPKPDKGALSRVLEDGTSPAIDNGFVRALKSGRIAIVPEVERFEGRLAKLKGGSTLEPDVVICGTGYRPGLEPLVGDLEVLDDSGLPRFSADQSSDVYPGLWFFGFKTALWGNLNERRREARRLAKLIRRRHPGS